MINPTQLKLSFKEKVAYGFGDAGCSMYWKIFSMYMVYFYTDVLGITAAAAGTLLLVTRIWDTTNDPLMGLISDRTTSRFGKYRPYLIYASIPMAAIGVLTFTAPDIGMTGKLVYAYATYTLMMMAYTVVNVPYGALLGVMSPNPKERTQLGSFRMVFAFAGSMLVLGIAEPLVSLFSSMDMAGDNGEAFGWQMTMLVIGVMLVIFLLITFYGTKERIEPPKERNLLKEDLKDLINNKPWLLLLGAGIFVLIFNSIRDGSIVYYFQYYVDTNGAEINLGFIDMTYPLSSLFMIVGQGANLVGVIFATVAALYIGRKYAYIGSMAIAITFSLLFALLGPTNILLMFAFQVIISFCAGLVLPLLLSMFGDAADYNEWKNGRRATGLVFSSYSTSQKLGWTLGTAFIGYLLAWFGYEAGVDQAEATLTGIQGMMSFFPAIGAFVSAVFIFFYKLDDDTMKKVVTELEETRSRKESEGE